jgi:hypothetical protein
MTFVPSRSYVRLVRQPTPRRHPGVMHPTIISRATVVAATFTLSFVAQASATTGTSDVNPAQLARGDNPGVPVLIRDKIHDGTLRIDATTRGQHLDLWRVDGGYVVNDVLGGPQFRLTFVNPQGRKRFLVKQPGLDVGVAVSPNQALIAWSKELGELRTPTMVTVARPATGKVVAKRQFHFATVLGVKPGQVLITRKAPGTNFPGATWWWNYHTDTFTKVSSQNADQADVANNRVVFSLGSLPGACHRIASLTQPEKTLWRNCRIGPRRWSPNGAHVLATHLYFDDVGTNLWRTLVADTGDGVGRLTGRFDWDAIWEDNHHFLVIAQNRRGIAAIVRCNKSGRNCERASRKWDMGPVDAQPNYVPPPVVLPDNQ